MSLVAPLPPDKLRKLFESHGYKCVEEREHYYAMARAEDDAPFFIPRKGPVVSIDVMHQALELFGMAKLVAAHDLPSAELSNE